MSVPPDEQTCRKCHRRLPLQWFWTGERFIRVCHADQKTMVGRSIDSVKAFTKPLAASARNQPILWDTVRHTYLISENGIIAFETDTAETAEHLRFSVLRRHAETDRNLQTISDLREKMDGER